MYPSVNNTLNEIKEILTKRNIKLSCAESCTGGLISSYLTDVDGASKFIEINFVTYAIEAKMRFLQVPVKIIEDFGVVSKETAYFMAKGLLKYSGISISTTGYLGPEGGDEINPIGTVYFGFAYKDKIKVTKYISNKTSRKGIKVDMTEFILKEFLTFLKELFG